MRNLLLQTVVLCSLLATCCAYNGSFMSPDVISQLHSANVVVIGDGTTCSGVLVGQSKVLTAAHCVEMCAALAVNVATSNGRSVGRVGKCDPDADLALLDVDTKTTYQRWIAPGPARPGDPVYIVGNPILAMPMADFTTFGIVGIVSPTQFIIGAMVRGGSSGGGVYDLKGRLVGIVSGVPLGRDGAQIDGLTVAVSQEPIAKILE